MKANEKFRENLENTVATLITDAKVFQARIEEAAKAAIVFAIAHGRTIYLNQLVKGLPANMAQTVIDLVDATNRKAVATMVDKDKQSEILAVIDNDVARQTGHVRMLDKTNDGYVIGKTDASKVARRVLSESYETEDAMVTAMSKISEAATAAGDARRTAQFDESRSAANFRDAQVKRIAGSDMENAVEHALHVGLALNTPVIIPDPAKRITEDKLKSMIAGALIAAKREVPEEYRKHLPTVNTTPTENQGTQPDNENDQKNAIVPEEGVKRGRKVANG